MYLPEPAWSETVTVTRAGAAHTVDGAAYDPDQRQLFLPAGVDVRQGDVIGVRSLTRRVEVEPSLWLGAGVVVTLEEAPSFLPDLGTLYRLTSGHFDTASGQYVDAARMPLWTGACSVEVETLGSEVDVAEQRVTVQPLTVQLPLEVTDVKPGDVFRVTSSRDVRLTSLDLTVLRVESGSTALTRVVRVIENQG